MATPEWTPPAAPALAHLFTMQATLAPGLDGGEGPLGRRTLNAAAQGEFRGHRLRGEINPGTGDWMLTRNKISVVDARVVLRTDDGALIHMSYGGRIVFPDELGPALRDASRRHLIDSSKYYFRTTPTFETGAPQYDWLNRIIAIGIGDRPPDGPIYNIFEVL